MPHTGVLLDNQWSHWPGVTYSLPVQCWVGMHPSAVITGIAAAGINAPIELAGAGPHATGPAVGCCARASRSGTRSGGPM